MKATSNQVFRILTCKDAGMPIDAIAKYVNLSVLEVTHVLDARAKVIPIKCVKNE